MEPARSAAAPATGTRPRVSSQAWAAGDHGWLIARRASVVRTRASRASEATSSIGTSAPTRSGRRPVMASNRAITSGKRPRDRPDSIRPTCCRESRLRSASVAWFARPRSAVSQTLMSSAAYRGALAG